MDRDQAEVTNSTSSEMDSGLMYLCEAAASSIPYSVNNQQQNGDLASKHTTESPGGMLQEEHYCKEGSGIFNSAVEGSVPVPRDNDPYSRGHSATPATVKESDTRTNGAEKVEETPSGLTERRSKRARKRKSTSEAEKLLCPICGYKMNVTEAENHVQTEIYRLKDAARRARSKISSEINSNRSKKPTGSQPTGSQQTGSQQTGSYRATITTGDQDQVSPSTSKEPAEIKLNGHQRYQSYLRIKTSRERRSAKRNKKPNEEDTVCPVCNEQIIGLPAELADHVDVCLRTREEVETIDVEGDDEDFTFEEYTWAGQTRIRTSTMLPGGLAASGFQVNHRDTDEDVDVELDVDGDDSVTFGSEQYNESDLIPCSAEPDEEKERMALRGALIGNQFAASPVPPERTRWSSVSETGDPADGDVHTLSNTPEDATKTDHKNSVTKGANEIIESLKEKIREQTRQLNEMADVPKCLICMERYTIPLVSIQCWHVHCEECWLRTMGTKKLCPQCNMITSPADLRKIYL